MEKLGRGKLFIRQVRTRARGSFVNKHTGSLNESELTIGSVDRDFEHGDIFQSNYVGIKVVPVSIRSAMERHCCEGMPLSESE